MMKRFTAGTLLCALAFSGCARQQNAAEVQLAQQVITDMIEQQAEADSLTEQELQTDMDEQSTAALTADLDEIDPDHLWDGTYQSAASVTLEVLQEDADTFAYCFSDGTAGNAEISGNIAKSSDETLNFLFADGIITVVGGALVGNYNPI